MLCPFELSDTRFEVSKSRRHGHPKWQCRDCGRDIPAGYVHGYRRFPPVIIPLVGSGIHGKTVFVAALMYALRQLSTYWPRFHCTYLDDQSLNANRELIEKIVMGGLPPVTPKAYPRPLMSRLVGMPFLRPVTLLIFDNSDGVSDCHREMAEYASYLKHCPVVLILHTAQWAQNTCRSLMDLAGRYLQGIAAMGGDTRRQHLIVVFTKADTVAFGAPFGDLNGAVAAGGVEKMRQARSYLRSVWRMSHGLRQFTLQQSAGAAFYNFAAGHFKSVSFSLVSSLGSAPTVGRFRGPWSPKRVLDPIFLTIKKSLPWWRRWW